MGRATLTYCVKDNSINIFSDMLFNIDKYTSRLKNERDLFDSIPKDEYFDYFLSNNQSKGSFKITYVDSTNIKRSIPVLYDEHPIEIDDIKENGTTSESELARRSLLNSKEQLYSKLFLLNKDVEGARKYTILISDEEKEILEKHGIKTYKKYEQYAVSVEDLIRYRSTHRKLGEVRDIYEQALDIWKEKMDILPYDDIYFFSREYRIINKYYNRIRQSGLTVSNLNIEKANLKALRNRIKVKTIEPLMVGNKKNKNKVMNKYNN